ncbi:hypothetical protein N658DRAFT_501312 [Parathielavia hyrcaniae]|uniref:Saponin hydrolase n=1 Tax=Parathielavia hyrcaniae TaxID=113614 RepID=A0AAN6PRZ2_9PEZI|nr:hypothetical protein N658DRAFT_501312 [Parathielavia hyrcaniae]
MGSLRNFLSAVAVAVAVSAQDVETNSARLPSPPKPEPIDIFELPLPPVAPSRDEGACTPAINPRRTGCIGIETLEFQAGSFTTDGNHVVVTVELIGAPAAPDPASIYKGEQLLLIKADGKTFPNGDTWKCLSCGVPADQARSLDPERDYPHVFRSGKNVLWGHNILDCGGADLASTECTPDRTHIYPIHWPNTADGSGRGGIPREMRLHPDDVHMGWSSFTSTGGQFCYFGRLQFNPNPSVGEPRAPRFDLVNVNLLNPSDEKRGAPIFAEDGELRINRDAITVGELRGFSGAGDEILYLGSPWEANNIDVLAVHVVTGAVRRLTSHPDYTDPLAYSPDNKWFVVMDTRVSERQMFMSGMRWLPPLVDIVAVTAASSTRNNHERRFFQPILIDQYGDRGDYFGQQVNAGGDSSNGAVNDPNWNGRADPAFSHDGTKITYWQALVVPKACGDPNPLPCPNSTAQGGRTYRVMVAHLTSRKKSKPAKVFKVPDFIPWAQPFPAGSPVPASHYSLPPGNYTVRGRVSGGADVTLLEDPAIPGRLRTVSVAYQGFVDEPGYVINGHEEVSVDILLPDVWNNMVHWYSDIVQTGAVQASKKTSPDGFHLLIHAVTNVFQANGTLTTTIDGVEYHQPANGT